MDTSRFHLYCFEGGYENAVSLSDPTTCINSKKLALKIIYAVTGSIATARFFFAPSLARYV